MPSPGEAEAEGEGCRDSIASNGRDGCSRDTRGTGGEANRYLINQR